MTIGLDEKCKAEYDRIIAEYKPIMLTTVGSRLLGLETNASDTDILGVYIEPPSKYLGFNREDTLVFRTAEYRTGQKNEKSMPYDIDLTLYGLRKFLSLVMGGNPILTVALYNTHSRISTTEIGEALYNLRQSVVSRNTLQAFHGFAYSELQKLNKTSVLEDYSKHATYGLALSVAGKGLALDGLIRSPLLSYGTKEYITKYRSSIDYSSAAYKIIFDNLEEIALYLKHKSALTAQPDAARIENWMLNAYRDAWDGSKEYAPYKPEVSKAYYEYYNSGSDPLPEQDQTVGADAPTAFRVTTATEFMGEPLVFTTAPQQLNVPITFTNRTEPWDLGEVAIPTQPPPTTRRVATTAPRISQWQERIWRAQQQAAIQAQGQQNPVAFAEVTRNEDNPN